MADRNSITETLMQFFMRPHVPDPRIPPVEGNVFGTPMPDPWRLDQSSRARRAVEADNRLAQGYELPLDPRMRGWRR